MAGGLAVTLLLLSSALISTNSHGLSIIRSLDTDCSQEGIQCTVNGSSCMDISWIKPYTWTPSAPSTLDVNTRVGLNDQGLQVPVLEINWTLAVDSSILNLQGVEVSVLHLSTNQQVCVQFHFGNVFPNPRNSENKPWKFSFNNFEVAHSDKYHVTVQNLPRQGNGNSKGLIVTVPSYCWNPKFQINKTGNAMVVSFDTWNDANDYKLYMINSRIPRLTTIVPIKKVHNSSRLIYTIELAETSPVCWYKFQLWPVSPSCASDCVRQNFVQPCDPSIIPPPEPVKRMYLWPVAASVTLALFGCVIVACCWCGKWQYPKPLPPTQPPTFPVKVKKVWIVYSADHSLYVDVVIKLADFLKVAWGMEVILDKLHINDIAAVGPMAWLGRKKSEMENMNGTILVLCSRGAQEKWKAMQTHNRVTLREDEEGMLGDLFTAALSLIAPDFQKRLHYERYVIAYFGGVCSAGDVPSIFEICPTYELPQNLQEVFFRIQKQEQYQSSVRFNVPMKKAPAYETLITAMKTCKAWQEQDVDWFKKQCSPRAAGEVEIKMNEEDIVEGHTVRVKPLLQYPESPVSMVNPIINKTSSTVAVNPVIVDGPPSVHVQPLPCEDRSTVHVVRPFPVANPGVASIQAPRFEERVPLMDQNVYLNQDLPEQPDQVSTSTEFIKQEALRFFLMSHRDFLEDCLPLPDEHLVPEAKNEPQTSDEGYLSWISA
ncbi:interleukin-17 receptor A [Pelodytes ibericus]